MSDLVITQVFSFATLLFSAYLKHRDTVQSRRITDESIRSKATQAGVFALLRDRIIAEYRRITVRVDPETGKPYIHLYELENIEKLDKEYHNLGGNGTIAKLVKELMDLPVK